jgi:hypothetical protein
MSKLNKYHLITFLIIFVVFTIITFLITNDAVDRGVEHNGIVLKATLETITGPMVGALTRGWQDCCLKFSLWVMMFTAPVLLLCILFQFIPLPDKKWRTSLRMFIWILGWIVWFLGGILSFGHALS